MNNVWQEILNLINKSGRNVIIKDGSYQIGKEECDILKIPIDTVLYTVVCNTNGIIVDNWIYIFGQEGVENHGIRYYNNNPTYEKNTNGLFIVSSDIVGGLYAININRYANGVNLIWYFAPDTLEWECINMKYNEFIAWILQGNIDDFYSTMRWKNWKQDCVDISMNYAMLIYPFLWAKECDIENASKKVVPLDEIIALNFHYKNEFVKF